MPLSLKLTKALHGLTSSQSRRALRLGVAPSVEHRRILRSESWRTIVDIGANRGQFALAALAVHPHVVIHSFEPLEGAAKIFRMIFNGTPNVHLHNCAIGQFSHSAQINISARDDSSSLLPISDHQVRVYPGTQTVGTASVQVKRLCEVLRGEDLASPALLKLDVQGYESSVLEGCTDLLPFVDAIYAECSLIEFYKGQHLLTEIAAWLHQKGFRITDIGDLTRDSSGAVVQGDFLFRKDSLHSNMRGVR